ncbi:hypothetical protein H5202_08425 [Shewanella sp. SG41-4]|uniref:hypothetical protein n=1 Tax=Shewanella sp. SG41-4 TaxID=2760976 RepID=UPI0016025818|nr:hypothetical protein [Shewanella sp. SG41-4]MBB1438706.1 hypothetical protein [Shewanella sp. SG41-4]
MQLKKLTPSFYIDNQTLIQALDFDMKLGEWMPGKVRGHGIVKISLGDLTFAIPVHSNIRHDASLILVRNKTHPDPRIKGMGLDYAKAMLIKDDTHISDEVFGLKPRWAIKHLEGKEHHVEKQFTAYVDKYVQAQITNDIYVLNSMEYRFSTLVNYHTELGL